jgi:fumarylacetoacetase
VISDLNPTHDPALRSWVASANLKDCDFPIQNLPLAVFRRLGSNESFRAGAAIGDQILDLKAIRHRSAIDRLARSLVDACEEPALNRLMSMGRQASSQIREHLSSALRAVNTLEYAPRTLLFRTAKSSQQLTHGKLIHPLGGEASWPATSPYSHSLVEAAFGE